MKRLPSPGSVNPILANANSGLTGLSQLINAWSDYKKTCEIEETKRNFINAKRDICIEQIKAQRYILEQYLTKSFSERRLVIEGMFNALDKGIEKGDDNLIAQAMDSIVKTVKSSPLEGIQNLMHQIEDQNVEVIDI